MSDYPANYKHTLGMMKRLHHALPGTMDGFGLLHQNTTAPGALDVKTKELIALSIAITVRCNGCISYHVHDALKAGANKDEILETIGVAILMGGGPSVMYGMEAYEATVQFEKKGLD